MSASVHEFRFDGQILRRGFWLYVWEITPPTGPPLFYVGRTGDSSSPNAQSPFNRVGQHLSPKGKGNALWRHLATHGVKPEACRFRHIAYGPILPEADPDGHNRDRDIVAALECALAGQLRCAGYNVINMVKCRMPLDAALFATVRSVFAMHFERLSANAGQAEGVTTHARSGV